MEKLLTEELLKQIKLINYDRSKSIFEQKEKIKPIWNNQIKEFVHPAYVSYLDVPKDKIYKKNSDGTFSLKYSSEDNKFKQEKVSTNDPEVIKKRMESYQSETFNKFIKDQKSGDKFRTWVNENPEFLKKVNDELKKSGIGGTFSKSGPFNNNTIKIAWKTVGEYFMLDSQKENLPNYLESLYDNYLENLDDIEVNTDSQQIASYRKNPKSLDALLAEPLYQLDTAESDTIKNFSGLKDDIDWVETYSKKFVEEFVSGFDNSQMLYGGYNQYLGALEKRNKIASKMGWYKPAKHFLKESDIENLTSISKTTAIDPSFIIAVTWLDTIQQLIINRIRGTLVLDKDTVIKPADYNTWTDDKKAQWTFTNLFSYVSENDFVSGLRQQLNNIEQVINYVYVHNLQLMLQTTSREFAGEEKSNMSSCRKSSYQSNVEVRDGLNGQSKKVSGYFFYDMFDACKKYGGVWIDGATSAKRCGCADIPVGQPVYVTVPALNVGQKKQPGGGTIKFENYGDIIINLNKSSEKIKDIRDIDERTSDVVSSCASDYHCWLDLASVGSLIIPGVGLVISALIDAANAVTYLVEAGLSDNTDDRNAALLGAGFSMLGAVLGGGGSQLFKGVPPEVVKFGNEFTGIITDVYTKTGKSTLGKIEQEEIKGAWEMLSKKYGLSQSGQKMAENYLKQISKLNTEYLPTYFKSVQELSGKIGRANFRKIGQDKKFIELLRTEGGNIITTMDKYMKTQAGKEFLQELGLFVILSDEIPRLTQELSVSAAETGVRPVIGGKTSLATMVQVSGYDLKTSQQEFGSDRSAKDNELMRSAWFSGWRPGMDIISLDKEDTLKQLQLRDEGKISTITPKFISDTKFSKYATTTLKKNIYKKFEQEFYTNKESEEKKEERITINFVDDENFEKENLKSNNTIIPKSYKNKLDNLNKSNVISDEEYQSVIDELENL